MSFCTSCGANVPSSATFCTSCGKPITGAAPAAGAPSATAPSKSGPSVLKIVLIVVAVFFGIGLLFTAVIGYSAYRIARETKIEQHDGEARVETPFGTVETHQDAEKAAEELGVAIYPGATTAAEGASSVQFGKMHVATAVFETEDPPGKVAEFYRNEFPQAKIVASEGDHHSIMVQEDKAFTSINIERAGDKTRITIARTEK